MRSHKDHLTARCGVIPTSPTGCHEYCITVIIVRVGYCISTFSYMVKYDV